jgi:putative PIG3 family NAD(P)H quinone oxidoreductase
MGLGADDVGMRCVRFVRAGGPEVIELAEVPDPKPAAHEVIVRVRAAGLNRADLIQRMGKYPAPPGAPADIPGLEFAGEIEAVGSQAKELAPERALGDRVMGIVAGGAQAQRLAVHARMLIKIPPAMGFDEAAAVPEAFITAHDALFTQARLAPGETVLIHAVGSGVGTAALQLVRVAGALGIGTSRSREKLSRAVGLGLHHGLEVGPERRFAGQVLTLTGARGADVVLDFVGAPYLAENLAALGTHGRLASVGTLGGTEGALDLGVVMRKRLTVFGTLLRARLLEEKITAIQAFSAQVMPLFIRGLVRPVLDRALPMDEVRAAHERLQKDEGFGKIVLRMD